MTLPSFPIASSGLGQQASAAPMALSNLYRWVTIRCCKKEAGQRRGWRRQAGARSAGECWAGVGLWDSCSAWCVCRTKGNAYDPLSYDWDLFELFVEAIFCHLIQDVNMAQSALLYTTNIVCLFSLKDQNVKVSLVSPV